MPVTDAQSWINYCKGIKPLKREISPDAIVANSSAFVTEDAENWIVTPFDSDREPMYHAKAMEPNYILALLYKWGFNVVNAERVRELEQ